MKPKSISSRPCVQQIGEDARRLLTPGQRGKVLAVLSNSAYLVSEQGEILWLGSERIPMHRRCLRVSGSLPTLLADSIFSVEDGCLYVRPSVQLDLSQALIWQTPQYDDNNLLEVTEIPTRVRAIFSVILDFPALKGFGQFLPEILALSENQPFSSLPENNSPLASLARPTIDKIARACLSGDISCLLQTAEALAGLGEGLTPSGDDFLGGLSFCIKQLHSIYPFFSDIPDLSKYVEGFVQKTNPISLTILRDLADGHGVDPLHQFFACILTNQPLENAHQHISQLIQIGHSTGWDLLTGVLTGLLLTFRNHKDSTYPTSLSIEHRVPV